MADVHPQALAFGEILFDVFSDGAYLGGAPLNFAWYLRQFGVTVGMVSAVGKDEFGEKARSILNNADIDQRYVTTNMMPTGTVDVTLAGGQPEYTINEGVAWDAINISGDVMEVPDLLYYGTLAQRTAINRTTLSGLTNAKPSHRFFDINLRQHYYTDTIILDGLRNATITKLNDDEWVYIKKLTGVADPQELIAGFELQALIVTHGGDGASIFEKGNEHRGHGPSVEVVDAVGAGDSFSATIAAAVLRGVPLSRALSVACEVGAFVVTQRGAQAILADELRLAFG